MILLNKLAVQSHNKIDTHWPVNFGGGMDWRFSLNLTGYGSNFFVKPKGIQ